jgi:hypothetical protein
MYRFLFAFSILLMGGGSFLMADDTGTGQNLLPVDFESGTTTYNPWAGVDDTGTLHVWTGSQLAVDTNGSVGGLPYSPSVAVGDLNGDGLPDLVVADIRGYIWFFPNSGKPNAPAFTHGEIMPVWVGGPPEEGEAVPRIQLLDFTETGKLDLVIGNYIGGLYIVHNHGSVTAPDFSMPQNRTEIQIPTHRNNLLWCNYLTPFLFDWSGTGRLDLLMGDGSYSANSIYLFTNTGSNASPGFNEEHRQKLIPGMGREDLTPQVVDWNNDGKPDIITGERTGYLDLYLNKAANKSSLPIFDKDNPEHVSIGNMSKFGTMTTVCVADLNHDKLFDLVIGTTNGRISYAFNTGKPGEPKFDALVQFKGVNPYPKIVSPNSVELDIHRPSGTPYRLLECVNNQTDPSVTLPPNFKGHGALKSSIFKPQNTYFKDPYVPADTTFWITLLPSVHFEVETRYVISMWVRAEGDISDITWMMIGAQSIDNGLNHAQYAVYQQPSMGNGGSDWTKLTQEIKIPAVIKDNPEKKKETGDFGFRLLYHGDGALYVDDVSLKRAN